jgi:hypothetical protein
MELDISIKSIFGIDLLINYSLLVCLIVLPDIVYLNQKGKFTISALIIILLLTLCSKNITIETKACAQLSVPNVKSNTSRLANPSSAVTTNNNAM